MTRELDIKSESRNGDYVVSTVKLAGGAVRIFQEHSDPFETMVFPAMNGKIIDWGEVYSESHATAEEARDAHRRIVKDIDRKRIPGKVRA